MTEELSDAEYVERLLNRLRLVVATDDDIPIETKLDTQPMIKEFEATLGAAPDQQDQQRALGQYDFLLDALDDYPNCTALLSALKNFVPYL